MKHKEILVCVAALAVAAASTAALAAKPVSKERQAAIAKIANNHRELTQPRTMAEAERTKLVQADGTVQIAVPTELWNELSARKDAQGNLQVSEADGTAVPATTVEVAADE
jgi:hypothetical protein